MRSRIKHQLSIVVFVLGLLLGLLPRTTMAATPVTVGYYDMIAGQGVSTQIAPITTAGHTPVLMYDLTSAELSGVDVLFVQNPNNGGYGGEYLSRLASVQTAVSNGMVLILHDRYVDPAETILPGGAAFDVRRDLADPAAIDVLDNTTLVTNGPGGIVNNTTLDNGSASSHGFTVAGTLPASRVMILSRTDPSEIVTFSYSYGSGSVVYSSIPLDYYLSGSNPFSTIYAPNVVAYGASLASPNQSPIPEAGPDVFGDEGTTITLNGSATDADVADTLSYIWSYVTITGGTCSFTSANAAVTSIVCTDNGTYEASLTVNDGVNAPVTDKTTVTVENVAPVVSAGDDATINEGDTFSGSGSFTDPGADTWTATVDYGDGSGVQPLTLSADKTFALSHIYADNGAYNVTVTVTDDDGGVGTDTLVVTVNNVAPSVAVDSATVTVDEGQPAANTGTFSDPGADTVSLSASIGTVTDNGNGTWSWSFNTSDGPDESQTVIITATDSDNASTTTTFVLTVNNVAPVVNAGDDAAINEGDTFSGSGSFTDPGADTWSGTVDYGDGSGIQPLTLNADKTFALNHIYADNGDYIVTVTVTDEDSGIGTDTLAVTVNNVAPTLGAISVDQALVPVNIAFNASASFTDPGTIDTHTAAWDWGNGTSPGTVTQGAGSGSVSDSHSYSVPGVYTVKLTVTDNDGAPSNESVYQYVVVYDPEGGFVTGGGWIDSPAGAYAADPLLTGKASFGFVSKYQKGATVPTGQTQFQFKAGDHNFHSSSYEWLVVAGANAKYKGVGTINGAGNFGFMLTATDGQINGGGGFDKFRIKIWDKDNADAVVYDNQSGVSDDSYDGTALGGGSIVIHDGKQAKSETVSADSSVSGAEEVNAEESEEVVAGQRFYLPLIDN